MDLEKIKQYLRVDTDEEDAQIELMMSAAKNYIIEAVGEYDDGNPKANMLLAAMVQDFYDSRELMQSEQQLKKRMTYVYQSIILQLRLSYELKQEETGCSRESTPGG